MSMFWPLTVIRIPSVRRWSSSNMAVIFHRDCAVLRFHRTEENATTIYRLEFAYNNLHLQWIYRRATERSRRTNFVETTDSSGQVHEVLAMYLPQVVICTQSFEKSGST